jgi:restriction endonuclease in pPIWI_RE module
MFVGLDDDLLQRRARVTSAGLRAAYAWSARSRHPQAFAELCRMTGVVMLELGPGRGPVAPVELVAQLQKPLGEILPPLPQTIGGDYGSGIDAVVLLTEAGDLADAAYEIGSDYVRDVMAAADPGRVWLPAWSWMRANDVETQLFAKLRASGDEAAYTKTRRFVVEHAAGDERTLTHLYNAERVTPVAGYGPVPQGQSYRLGDQRWWWPCRVCGWAMDVHRTRVRCRYRYHLSTYQVAERGEHGPVLFVVGQQLPAGLPKGLPARQDAAGAVVVDEPVWRFVVVPGATEVRLGERLRKQGAEVLFYPGFDRYDLGITVGDQVWDVDVKEHATVEGLLRHIAEKPPQAKYLVIPDTHGGQVHALVEALSSRYRVLTETDLIAQVTRVLRRGKARTA